VGVKDLARFAMTGAALGVVMGLWAVEAQAEAGPPGSELALAMGQYLDLRQSVVTGGSEAEAARFDRAAAEVARACDGKLPGDCLFAEALALAATAEEVEDKPRDAGWLTRSEAQARIVVYLIRVDDVAANDVETARRLALAIEDRTERRWAQRGILRVLASEDYYNAAVESLRDRDSNIQIAEGVNEIVALLIVEGETETALEVQAQAILFAKEISIVDARGKALALVASHYLKLKDISAAMGLIGQIEDEYWKKVVSIWVAEALAKAGEVEAALRLVDGIKVDERQAVGVLSTVAVGLAEAGLADEARSVADRLADPFDRAVLIGRVAVGLSKAGQTEAALAQFAEAEALAAGLAEPEDQAVVLTVIAVAMIDAARVGDALALMERVKALGLETDKMQQTYIRVAKALIAAGESEAAVPLLGLAEGIAGKILEEEERSHDLLDIARVLIKGEAFAEAERVAVGIGEASSRVYALKDLGVALAGAGRADEALRLAGVIVGIEGAESARASGLGQVAKALAEAGEVASAEGVAEAVVEPDWRAQALAEVAEALAATHPSDAERIGRRVEDPGWRSVVLAAVAAGL
jgi:tetratricopeptide (TPR) repeat protein